MTATTSDMSDRAGKPKILIVRRDNIGDLICTLPLIASIRKLHPTARIDLLVNSYSAAVAGGNPDIDHLYVYTKAKHRAAAESVLGVHARRLWMTLQLRFAGYDWLVLANAGCMPRPLRWARQVGAKNIVGFSADGCEGAEILTHPIPFIRRTGVHEVEYLMQLLQPFGAVAEIPAARITPEPDALAAAQRMLCPAGNHKPLIGINISARLPSQQWPADRFIELIYQLQADARCVLFWAPGSQGNAGHPGDDEKAALILNACAGADVTPYPTQSLSQLIAGISCTDLLITADGGALHIGAACNKPIVALFGDSDSKQWYPWRVPHIILHPESRDVRSISAQQVSEAVRTLQGKNA
jgi:ADP-heptose:LPS heptosyltransferase